MVKEQDLIKAINKLKQVKALNEKMSEDTNGDELILHELLSDLVDETTNILEQRS